MGWGEGRGGGVWKGEVRATVHTTEFFSFLLLVCAAEMLESSFSFWFLLLKKKKRIKDNVLGRVGWGVVDWFLPVFVSL
jgi:hypothetical protein